MKEFKLDKRTVAGILLGIALLTMFFDCVSFSGSSDMSTLLRYSFGVSASLYGNTSETRIANSISNMFSSGGLTVYEIRGLFANLNRLDHEESFSAFSIIFAVLILVTLFAGGYALYGVYLRKKARGFWFASMLLVLIMAEGIIAAAMGSGYYVDASMTLWPFIGLGCAIASIVLCFKAAKQNAAFSGAAPFGAPAASFGTGGGKLGIDLAKILDIGKALGKQVGQKVGQAANAAANMAANAAASAAAANSWTCPQCGRQVDGASSFCSACGSPRPEKRFCPKCGSECKDGAAFCSKCGFRLGDMSSQSAQPAQNPYGQAQNPYGQAQNPYGQAQNPYGQMQNPYGQAQNPYGQAQNPYGQAQNPYGQAQNPYGQVQNPYGQAQNQSSPGQDSCTPAQSESGTLRVTEDSVLTPLSLSFEIDQSRTGFHQECRLNILTSLTVGRNPSNDLRIDDNVVSGNHLRIDRSGSEMLVTDLNSSNGTALNGVPVHGTVPLNNGGVLQIGYTLVKVWW